MSASKACATTSTPTRRGPRGAVRTLFLLLSAALALGLLAGCQAAQKRGVAADAGNAYVSSSRPSLQVTVRDLPLVASGFGVGRLHDSAQLGDLSVDTWTAVYAKGPEGPMAAVIHSELPATWQWTTVYPRGGSVDARTEYFGGKAWAACTYLQPVATDPFAGLAGEPQPASDDEANARPAYWLVRSFAAIYGHTLEKIVLEYREPAPVEWRDSLHLDVTDMSALAAFRERALKTFTVADEPTGSDIRVGNAAGIRWRYLDDTVLGPVMERNVGD